MNSAPPAQIPPANPPLPTQPTSAGKWMLIGCGGCLVMLLVCAVVAFGIYFFAMGVVKKTDVYTDALKKAQTSQAVQEALGNPVVPTWAMQGSVEIADGKGTAEFKIPLSGPKGSGTLIVKANKVPGGDWEYSVLEVVAADTDRKIPLQSGP